MQTRVLALTTILTFCAACATERIVEKPVPVPGPTVYKFVEIPPELLVRRQKTDIPESITWGEGGILWSLDRATIDMLLGQLEAIRSLANGDSGNTE